MTENIVKPYSPFDGVFDHLWNTQEDDLGYQYTQDPALMTPEEKAAEFGRLWDWNKLTPEQKRAELERQKMNQISMQKCALQMKKEVR